MPAGKKVLKEGESQNYGPSWYDAHAMLTDLHKKWPGRLQAALNVTHSVDGRSGWHFAILDCVYGTYYGDCGYGPAYPNGAKTMPAAIVHACIKAERYIDLNGLWDDDNLPSNQRHQATFQLAVDPVE